jgi:16S rRNA (cytosine967-C5)-methyltransferase
MIPPSGAVDARAARAAVTASRIVAAELLADLRAGVLLDAAFDRRVGALDERDRRWVHELTYGVLRRRSWLDSLLTERVRGGLARLDPDLTDLLRSGAYQLLHMRSVPPYAAIAQTVELAKNRHGLGASKLVNAVLRRLDRERADIGKTLPSDPVEALVVQHSHPRWIIQRWIARYGALETAALLAANNLEPPTFARPYNVVREQLEAALEADGLQVSDAPLVRDSVTLPAGTALTELGAYRHGQFFVQDPAATLVTQYACIAPNSVVADLCAAPGGKAIELSRDAAQVVAADRSGARLSRLAESIRRLDATGIELVVMDARAPALRQVDAVLLDAPCSGTGTFRRHPDARWRLKTSDIAVLASGQRSLLDSAANVVKPGGLLVYSTCSLEPEENDQPVGLFLSTHPQFKLEPPPAGTVPADVLDEGRLRVLPQRHGTDGAFAVRLRHV